MYLIFLLNALGAATFPLVKASLSYFSPQFFTGVRMVVAGIGIIAFQYYFYRNEFFFKKEYRFLLFKLAFFNVFLTNALQYWAIQYLTVSKTAFLFNLAPFFAVLFSYLFLGEKITSKKVFGISIAFASFLPLILLNNSSSGTYFYYIPEIALLVAAIASVLGWIAMKQCLNAQASNFTMANGLSMIIGGLMFFPLSAIMEPTYFAPSASVSTFTLYLIALILFNNLAAYMFYGYLLKRYNPALLFIAGFTNPLFAAAYGWIFLHESLNWTILVAAVGVSIGLWFYYTEEKRLGYI